MQHVQLLECRRNAIIVGFPFGRLNHLHNFPIQGGQIGCKRDFVGHDGGGSGKESVARAWR